MMSATARTISTRAARIRSKLETVLEATVLEVDDVSHHHAGHTAVRESGGAGETHFNVRVVSPKFEGKNLVSRHRMIYDALSEELGSGLHAISIVAKTPEEVATKPK